jgi:hypothetical protein
MLMRKSMNSRNYQHHLSNHQARVAVRACKAKRISRARALAMAVVAISLSLLLARLAGAVTLEQKWTAGQQMAYDLQLSEGQLSLRASSGAPFMWAGLPLDVALTGTGDLLVETRAVDPNGTGTVALKMPRLSLDGNALGMKAALRVENNRAKFLLSGQPMNGAGADASVLSNPTTGLQISRLGQVTGIVPLKTEADASTQKPEQKPQAGQKPSWAMGVDTSAQMAILRALPQLWPGRDVQIGEKWTVETKLPTRATVANATPELVNLGTVEMTLQAEETVLGRVAQRVSVSGTLSLSGAKADAVLGTDGDSSRRLTGMKQTVIGDVWFDAAAGQIVKANLRLNTQSSAAGTAKPKNEGDKPRNWTSTQDFEGTVQIVLSKVSYQGN